MKGAAPVQSMRLAALVAMTSEPLCTVVTSPLRPVGHFVALR
jgi:hypothetical protein